MTKEKKLTLTHAEVCKALDQYLEAQGEVPDGALGPSVRYTRATSPGTVSDGEAETVVVEYRLTK